MCDACVVDGCSRPRKTRRGHCGMHNERFRKYGDVHYTAIIVGDPERRFWLRVDKSGECWLWTGYLDPNGYGRFNHDRTQHMAHRWAWMLTGNGEIPEGMHLDHLCRVRNCVNPDHLEVVTPTENNHRSDGPTGLNYRKTECPKCGGDYSRAPNGKRYCAPCKEEWRRRRRAELRAKGEAA